MILHDVILRHQLTSSLSSFHPDSCRIWFIGAPMSWFTALSHHRMHGKILPQPTSLEKSVPIAVCSCGKKCPMPLACINLGIAVQPRSRKQISEISLGNLASFSILRLDRFIRYHLVGTALFEPLPTDLIFLSQPRSLSDFRVLFNTIDSAIKRSYSSDVSIKWTGLFYRWAHICVPRLEALEISFEICISS